MEISGSIKTYSLKCRLFKGEGKAIILICNLEEGLQNNEVIRIIKTYNIQYKTYNISAEFNVENCRLYKASYNIPFLYSSEQTINIQENQNKINVEFKFESYNNEPLILENHLNNGTVPLENCIKDGKILKCEILREKLDIISGNENEFRLRYYNDIVGLLYFKFCAYILINQYKFAKETLNLRIGMPINNRIKEEYYFTFPTNITKLPKNKDFFLFILKYILETQLAILSNILKGVLYI